jgi:18S rRNA (guanine1575-N7)-methyltransferase
MLLRARRSGAEVVQADMAKPLPFRPGAFDGAVSVSALQFLCAAADGHSADERLGSCLRETCRVMTGGSSAADSVRPAAAFQFHPTDAEADPPLVLRAATRAGCAACLVLDHPHHTRPSPRRWFLYCAPLSAAGAASHPTSCPAACGAHAPRRCACVLSARDWARSCGQPAPAPSAEHEAWLVAEHVRRAHELLRTLRHVEKTQPSLECGPAAAGAAGPLLSPAEVEVARRLRSRLGLDGETGGGEAGEAVTRPHVPQHVPTLDELKARADEVICALHGEGGEDP